MRSFLPGPSHCPTGYRLLRSIRSLLSETLLCTTTTGVVWELYLAARCLYRHLLLQAALAKPSNMEPTWNSRLHASSCRNLTSGTAGSLRAAGECLPRRQLDKAVGEVLQGLLW